MQSVAEAILQNGAGAIGPGQPMPIAGLQTVAFTLSGVFVATVTFEATTVDDPQPGDWYPLNAHQSGTAILGTTGTVPGIYRASIAGLTWVRARVSSWTSGAVTVNGKAVAVDDNSKLVNANITGRKVRVVRFRQEIATPVGAGASSQTTISPAAGYIGRVTALGYFVPIPAGAASGTHTLCVTVGTNNSYIGERLANSDAIPFGSAMNVAPSATAPTLGGVVFSVSDPLVFTYTNNTNVAQAGLRFYFVLYEEEAVTS